MASAAQARRSAVIEDMYIHIILLKRVCKNIKKSRSDSKTSQGAALLVRVVDHSIKTFQCVI